MTCVTRAVRSGQNVSDGSLRRRACTQSIPHRHRSCSKATPIAAGIHWAPHAPHTLCGGSAARHAPTSAAAEQLARRTNTSFSALACAVCVVGAHLTGSCACARARVCVLVCVCSRACGCSGGGGGTHVSGMCARSERINHRATMDEGDAGGGSLARACDRCAQRGSWRRLRGRGRASRAVRSSGKTSR